MGRTVALSEHYAAVMFAAPTRVTVSLLRTTSRTESGVGA